MRGGAASLVRDITVMTRFVGDGLDPKPALRRRALRSFSA
jgi:hypothetical protein